MAIRWASDRIGDQGVVALVTNGSWIEGNVDSGVRACLAEEFTTSMHVVNLRGNQRTQGERSRQEGGKIFGSGSRAPVAITILVRDFWKGFAEFVARNGKIVPTAVETPAWETAHTVTPSPHHPLAAWAVGFPRHASLCAGWYGSDSARGCPRRDLIPESMP